MTKNIVYQATDTAADFHADRSKVRGLMGSVGCGKSVASCNDYFSKAVEQEPDSAGVRRTRGAIIRSTYPELTATTIKTWKQWFPEDQFGKIKYNSPITQDLNFILPDKTEVHHELMFLSLDSPNDISKLASLELTFAYVNELKFCDHIIFMELLQRVGRYPSKIDGVPITWSGLIFDTNPPPTHHWMYPLFEKMRPEGYRLFKYPSPLLIVPEKPKGGKYAISLDGTIYINNPGVDYRAVQNNPDYWLDLVAGATDAHISVNIMGNYGITLSGQPVHPSYNDKLHYLGKKIPYNKDLPLGLGWDFGLTPACSINQLSARGQLCNLAELWTERMGLRDFVKNIVIPYLDKNFIGWRENYISRHDPAGNQKSQSDAKSCEDIFREEGIRSLPASTNSMTARRDGLKYFLGKMVDGNPAFALSMDCNMTRDGLMGNFQYPRIMVGGDERYHETPVKNIYSHICEALEYIAMEFSGITKKPPSPEKKGYRIHKGSFMGM